MKDAQKEPSADAPPPKVRAAGAPTTRCPYCHDDCAAHGDVLVCRSCLARHHRACWLESGACSNCAEKTPLAPVGAPALPPQIELQTTSTERGTWIRYSSTETGDYAEFTSHKTLFGLPLLHYTNGVHPETEKLKTARGVIAVGRRAIGLIAIGQLAFGVIAIGQLALGLLLGLGQLSTGLVAVGQMALAVLGSIGQVATGLFVPLAQMALGYWTGLAQADASPGGAISAPVVLAALLVMTFFLRAALARAKRETHAQAVSEAPEASEATKAPPKRVKE